MHASRSRGEQPLVVFISSVMNAELAPAREAVVRAIGDTPYLTPWAFEFTPASSDDAVLAYLDKVRTADLVVLLLGEETSEAVDREVAEALKAKRRLLAFELPATRRSPACEALIQRIHAAVKSVKVEAHESVGKVVRASIDDEVIRAVRRRPGRPAELTKLEEAARISRARCAARWQAVGLTRDESYRLADDPLIGAPSAGQVQGLPEPVAVLVGEMGVGKSLLAERLYQAALARARTDPEAPVPIFLDRSVGTGSLEEAVTSQAEGMRDPRTAGVFLVVDGADELGFRDFEDVLRAARVLAGSWPSSRFVLTARAVPNQSLIEEAIQVQPLSPDEAYSLVGIARGSPLAPHEAGRWPDSVREAVRRPLFALLLGSLLRAGQMAPQTSAGLVAALIDQASPAFANDQHPVPAALRRLAVLSTDRYGAPVPLAEIGLVGSNLETALATGMVIRSGQMIRFTLAIHRHWFASRSVLLGECDVQAHEADQGWVARWSEALALAVASGSPDQVKLVMRPLAECQPGEASLILAASVEEWSRGQSAAPPTPEEAAEQLTSAVAAFARGIGRLGSLCCPMTPEGQRAPLAVEVSGSRLSTAWYMAPGQPPEEVPPGAFLGGNGFDLVLSGEVSPSPAWAWRWAHKTLQFSLDRLLKTRSLPTPDGGPIALEAAHGAALALTRRGTFYAEPIELDEIEAALERLPVETPPIEPGRALIPIDSLRREMQRLRDLGRATLEGPWPGPDCWPPKDGWVWSMYSTERLLERTQGVLSGALQAYETLLADWFEPLRSVMATALLLPARLVGILDPRSSQQGGPVIAMYFEPMEDSGPSRAEVRIGEGESQSGLEMATSLQARVRALRRTPGSIPPAIAVTTAVLPVFGNAPATTLAYKWLWSDLKDVDWTRGLLRDDPSTYVSRGILGSMRVERLGRADEGPTS